MVLATLTALLLEFTSYELQYEAKWSNSNLRYDLFATFTRAAHCEPEWLKLQLEKAPSADLTTPCGIACQDMLQYTASTELKVKYFYNQVDHTQYIQFSSNESFPMSDSFDGKVLFAFRGTVGFDSMNMRRNLFFKFSPTALCDQCSIHQGFWRNYLSLRPPLAADLMETPAAPVFAGMSMGAPLATLAAALSITILTEQKTEGCITLGMPRVANQGFSQFMINNYDQGLGLIGFAFMRDPVPHVPPRFVGFKSTQAKLFHIYRPARAEYEYYMAEQGFDAFYTEVFVKRLYEGDAGDKMFAENYVSFSFGDHLKYFPVNGAYGCGYNFVDKYLFSTTAAELFFM